MNILAIGVKGMVGTTLCNNLKNIRDDKNKTRQEIKVEEIYEYDLNSISEELDEYCQKADFVFNLAGRFGNSEYGRSKKVDEELFFNYAEETGVKVAAYRFLNHPDTFFEPM